MKWKAAATVQPAMASPIQTYAIDRPFDEPERTKSDHFMVFHDGNDAIEASLYTAHRVR